MGVVAKAMPQSFWVAVVGLLAIAEGANIVVESGGQIVLESGGAGAEPAASSADIQAITARLSTLEAENTQLKQRVSTLETEQISLKHHVGGIFPAFPPSPAAPITQPSGNFLTAANVAAEGVIIGGDSHQLSDYPSGTAYSVGGPTGCDALDPKLSALYDDTYCTMFGDSGFSPANSKLIVILKFPGLWCACAGAVSGASRSLTSCSQNARTE